MTISTVPPTEAFEPLDREPLVRLENGDHLNQSEFHRRYAAMPRNVRAELIEGVVFMSSPARYKAHSRPQGFILGWFAQYMASTQGVELGDNATVILDGDNEFQPDAFLRLDDSVGGSSRVGKDDYIYGAPEFVVEIAASTASRDLYDKLDVYRRNGVQEYIVWRTQDNALDWFRLRAGKYDRVEPDADGILRSEVFPGLWLAVDKLLNGDLAGVLAELQKGIASAEHAAFVEKLAAQS
jgi:Uma2 family endonuclease